MIVNISSEINNDVFEKLIKHYNELKDKEILIIYLSTAGGDVEVMRAIIDLINENGDITELIAYGQICSAGFNIFYQTKCLTKAILPETVGMAHFTGVNVSFLDRNQPSGGYDKFFIEWSRKSKELFIKFCENLGFKKEEITRLKKGEDIWFLEDRLIEFMNNGKFE